MKEITIETFEKEKWQTGFLETSKAFVWFRNPSLNEVRNWLEEYSNKRFMVAWDAGNRIGRVWFESPNDARSFELEGPRTWNI
jgi:hypothetical protein